MSADPDPAVRERTTADRQPISEASGNSRSGGGAEAQGGQEDWRVVDIRQDAGARPLFQAVEHVPVKVGGPPSVDMTAPDPKPQLAQQVGQALEQGEQTLTLQLNPRYLGRVTVELTRTEDGALQVLLRPETAKAAQLLAEHSSRLGSLLQSGSHAPVQVEVQRYQESQQAQQHHAQDQQYNGQEGHSGGQRREQRQQQDQSQRFLQQFRLGLVSLSPEGP